VRITVFLFIQDKQMRQQTDISKLTQSLWIFLIFGLAVTIIDVEVYGSYFRFQSPAADIRKASFTRQKNLNTKFNWLNLLAGKIHLHD